MGDLILVREKAFYISLWIVLAIIRLIGIVFGVIVVPVGLLITESGEKWPWFVWLWGNDEDDPRIKRMEWWHTQQANSKNPLRRWISANWLWLAWRNPFNNPRFLWKDRDAVYSGTWPHKSMKPQEIVDAGMTEATRWARNGMFAGYRQIKILDDHTYTDLWVGFKVGHSTPGLGLTFRPSWIKRSF